MSDVFTEERANTLVQDYGGTPPPIGAGPSDPGNGGRQDSSGKSHANAILAMALFLGADVMFFAGLIGAFVVFRFGALHWPPPGQPLLPLGITGINTGILLISGAFMVKTWQNIDRWPHKKITKALTLTTLLGMTFLLVQGYEWFRLVAFGFKLTSGTFGGTFYTLIGCHALHVMGAVLWLATVTVRLARNRLDQQQRNTSIALIGMYWTLVVALWPILYGLVYWN